MIKKKTEIYLTSHRVRIWHKAVLWWGSRTNRDSCMAAVQIFDPVGIPPMGSLRHQLCGVPSGRTPGIRAGWLCLQTLTSWPLGIVPLGLCQFAGLSFFLLIMNIDRRIKNIVGNPPFLKCKIMCSCSHFKNGEESLWRCG